MKTIIAGTRTINDYNMVLKAIKDSNFVITEIVSGGAEGPDKLGEVYANANQIPIKHFLADWKTFGKSAGPIRNIEMGDYADALIAIWDGESAGTRQMISYAQKKRLKIFIKITGSHSLLDFI